jgi:cellulose synthase/poly-beta-1,6-N-acetylglucosamine synthase-like glycosyltransferase
MSLASVSIIITCEEQQQELMRLLPEVLSMPYEGEYEVIVVDKKHDKDMAEWLKEMEARYPHLCHTFCSSTARGIDVHKLALTLGAKASAYEWLVILSAATQLPSPDWLHCLTSSCAEGIDVVVGKTRQKHRWNLFRSIFCRTYSVFRPTSSILLCRRSIVLQGQVVKLSNCKIVKL